MAIGFLIVGVASMVKALPDSSDFADLMFRTHHVGVILQSLFMIPVAFGLHMIATQRLPRVGKTTLTVGVASLSSIVLCALLFLVNVVADDLYTVPQGVLGVWLMVVNRRMSSVLPRGLTRFGMVVGFGLLLVGTFPLAYGIFVDPIGLHGPIPPTIPTRTPPRTPSSMTSFTSGRSWASGRIRSGPFFSVAACFAPKGL